MNEQQLYEYLLNTLQPKYERAFGEPYRPNRMNISSLVSGTASYLYHWRERSQPDRAGEFNMALLEGAAFHAFINQKLEDFDKHVLYWNLPYQWKDPKLHDITIVGHFDNILPVDEKVLCEWKRTGQQDVHKNGLLIRAKRQVGAYGMILKYRTGIEYECFSVLATKDVPALADEKGETVRGPDGKPVRPRVPGKIHIFKLTKEEIVGGWEFVKRTAYEVARELDK